jgi:ATP-binding cassette, subfamily B (MDR/TAP), member 1
MGDGLVLEQGTHNELLTKTDGPYANLVQAQKLRESEETTELADPKLVEETEGKTMEKIAEEEVPLGRANTGRPLASGILEKTQSDQSAEKQENMSLFAIFKRIALINRDIWWRYAVGTVGAILAGFTFPAYGIVFCKCNQVVHEQDMRNEISPCSSGYTRICRCRS